MGAILVAWAPSNPSDERGHQAHALLCKGTAVRALFQFVLTAASSNDGAHGHGAAVGAVGAMFHVRKCAKCTVVGARATGATRTARLGNMNSGVHRVDMQCVRVCVYVYVVRLVGLCGGSRYWKVGLIARSCPLNVRGLARC